MTRTGYWYVKVLFVLWWMSAAAVPAVAASFTHDGSLDSLVTRADMAFLLRELARVEPPQRLRGLSGYGDRQLELGGGFYGILPDQLADPDRIPLPVGDAGRLDAALCLARQRAVNLAALKQINADYALEFSKHPLDDFLSGLGSRRAGATPSIDGLTLELDTSALDGFFNALDDGQITPDEAAALAALPSNQAMLAHRRNLGYVPEPLPDTESLAEMIQIAGSADPLDRLWCWINPQNAFGYADLTLNATDYRQFLADLNGDRQQLVSAVLEQIGAFAPINTQFDARFAFTVGWAIRGWTTPEMAGLNLEQVKDDWDHLFGTLVEETYHRLQLQLCPTQSGQRAREFSDLVAVDTGDERYDRLYEIVTYTVLEGSANLVRGEFAAPDLAEQAPAGRDLLDTFVTKVVKQGDLESADALVSSGLQGNGPLYGVGWKLASVIASHEGSRAVAVHLQEGPVHFFTHAASLAKSDGEPIVTDDVVAAVDALEVHLTP